MVRHKSTPTRSISGLWKADQHAEPQLRHSDSCNSAANNSSSTPRLEQLHYEQAQRGEAALDERSSLLASYHVFHFGAFAGEDLRRKALSGGADLWREVMAQGAAATTATSTLSAANTGSTSSFPRGSRRSRRLRSQQNNDSTNDKKAVALSEESFYALADASSLRSSSPPTNNRRGRNRKGCTIPTIRSPQDGDDADEKNAPPGGYKRNSLPTTGQLKLEQLEASEEEEEEEDSGVDAADNEGRDSLQGSDADDGEHEDEEDEDRMLEEESEEEEEGEQNSSFGVHPLERNSEVPPLSDLQRCITEAIQFVTNSSGYCATEDINKYVSKKWRSLRRRNGEHYNTCSSRAVRANLRTNPNGIALFKKDPSHKGCWTLCETLEEARAQQKKEKQLINGEDTSQRRLKLSSSTNALYSVLKETRPLTRSSSSPVLNVGAKNSDHTLNALQNAISQAIKQAGGSCHVDIIVDTISKNWYDIKAADELPRTVNVKKVVTSSLAKDRTSEGRPLFVKDSSAISACYWRLGEGNPMFASSSTGSLAVVEIEKNTPVPSKRFNHDQKKEGKPRGTKSKKKKHADGELSTLQEMIVVAISEYDGAATINQIYEHISKRWDDARRKDGMPYSKDCKRAIQSCISKYCTNASPIFVKKDRVDGFHKWGVVPKVLESLEKRKRTMEVDHNILPQQKRIKLENETSSNPITMQAPPTTTFETLSTEEQNANNHAAVGETKDFSSVQKLIIEVISNHGGSASFNTILDECTQKWGTLRKKDGSPYTADPKRSINTTLTRAYPSGPTFEKDPSKPGCWRLTQQSLARLCIQKAEQEILQPPTLTSLQALAIQIINEHNGSCPSSVLVEQLLKEIQNNDKLLANVRDWPKLKKHLASREGCSPMFKLCSNSVQQQEDKWTLADTRLINYLQVNGNSAIAYLDEAIQTASKGALAFEEELPQDN
ncbi:hypothetical protein QOT17_005490 [Balamuthia mandrillaris]